MPLDLSHEQALQILEMLGVTQRHLQTTGSTWDAGLTEEMRAQTIPEQVKQDLNWEHPSLVRMRAEYEDHPATFHSRWTANGVRDSIDLTFFRADNLYLWQQRGLSIDLQYFATAAYLQQHDKLGLYERLHEDGAFGAYVPAISDDRKLSRDLLDSVAQINVLSELVSIETIDHACVLDIGAGYGRMAHRLCEALPNVSSVLCADAVPESSFVCDYYLRYRNVADRATSVPLPQIGDALKNNKVHVAINDHCFSEIPAQTVKWWIRLVRDHAVPYIVIQSNETAGPKTATSYEKHGAVPPRIDLIPILAKYGYKLASITPKYPTQSGQDFCVFPAHFHCFELSE